MSHCFLIFLCFNCLFIQASEIGVQQQFLKVEKLISTNTNLNPVTAISNTLDPLVYSSNNSIFINESLLSNINLLDENEIFKVNRIVSVADDYYFASNMGLLRNQERIFSKTAVNDILINTEKIFIATDLGLYVSELSAINWKLLSKANLKIWQIRASKKSKNVFYLISNNGFYILNLKKNSCVKVNQGLKLNGDSSFFARMEVLIKERSVFSSAKEDTKGQQSPKLSKSKIKKEEIIYLASENAVYKLDLKSLFWRRLSDRGLKFTSNSQFHPLEIFYQAPSMFLVADTGIFRTELSLGNEFQEWKKLSSPEIPLNDNFLEGFTAVALLRDSLSKDSSAINLLLGNFKGDLYRLIIGSEARLHEDGENSEIGVPLHALELQQESHEFPREELVDHKDDENIDIFQRILKILSLEPSIQEIQGKALEFSGIPSGQQFNRYKRQARLRNLLPQISSSLDNSDYVLKSQEINGLDKYDSGNSSINSSFGKNHKASADNEFNAGLRVSWNLDQLIYDPEIVDIVNSARVTANIRENLLTELNQIYFQRKALLCELINNPFARSSSKYLKLQEFNADLDARTGGWFSLALEKKLSTYKELYSLFKEAKIEV